MANESDSNTSSANFPKQPPSQPPVAPSAPQQSAVGDDGKQEARDAKTEADELAKEFRAAEKWVIGTNVVLAIVGIIALCIYSGQLKVMRGQLGEIVRQYPQLQKSADAATSSADTAKKAVDDSGAAFKLDERAWVGLKSVNIRLWLKPMPALEPFASGDITVTNSGKTPAFDVATYTMIWKNMHELRLSDLPDINRKLDKMKKNASHSLIVPNTSVVVNFDFQLERDEFLPMQTETKFLYIIQRITYFDIFRAPQHTTVWCGRYSPHSRDPALLVACPEGFERAD